MKSYEKHIKTHEKHVKNTCRKKIYVFPGLPKLKSVLSPGRGSHSHLFGVFSTTWENNAPGLPPNNPNLMLKAFKI